MTVFLMACSVRSIEVSSVECRASNVERIVGQEQEQSRYSVRSDQYSVVHRIAPGSSSDREKNSRVHSQDPKPHTSPLGFTVRVRDRVPSDNPDLSNTRASGRRARGWLPGTFRVQYSCASENVQLCVRTCPVTCSKCCAYSQMHMECGRDVRLL